MSYRKSSLGTNRVSSLGEVRIASGPIKPQNIWTATARDSYWLQDKPMSTLYKFPVEERIYGFDFSNQTEISDGEETLSAVNDVDATLLRGSGEITIGTPSIYTGNKVGFTVSGGTRGDIYEVVCSVITSSGAIVAATGRLNIDEV